MNIPIPSKIWLTTRYGLSVTETAVTLVTWKRGSFTKIKQFVNDNQGLQDFSEFLKSNSSKYANKSVNICVNVIGEDYRFEKVAHLVGKYRSDMIKRRFNQLFRGTDYHIAMFQGRESIGRRQDFFLFCGILSNEKIQPWVRDLSRFNMNIAGLHLGSNLVDSIFPHITSNKTGVNVTSVALSDGLIRNNFYIDGHLRFSRLSRSGENASAEEIYRMVRVEIDKTSQYLVSIKLIQNNAKINVSMVVADDLVDDLREIAEKQESDRVTAAAYSARVVAGALGLTVAITEFGRDDSLMMHEMLRSFRFQQLAPLSDVRYYVERTVITFLSVAVGVWGISNVGTQSKAMLDAYLQFNADNASTRVEIAQLANDYQSLVDEFVQPPSSSENMRASVNILNHVTDVTIDPGKLLLYLSQRLDDSPSVLITEIEWFVSNERNRAYGGLYAFANGLPYYEILELRGSVSEEIDSEVAFDQYKNFVRSIRNRPDMVVEEIRPPALVEADGNLVVTLDRTTDIRSELNAFNNNDFHILISWDPNFDFEAEPEPEEVAITQ